MTGGKAEIKSHGRNRLRGSRQPCASNQWIERAFVARRQHAAGFLSQKEQSDLPMLLSLLCNILKRTRHYVNRREKIKSFVLQFLDIGRVDS
jgi:hypothetical protein